MHLFNISRVNVAYAILLVLKVRVCFSSDRLVGLKLEKSFNGSVFLTQFGENFRKCQENCANRPKCKSINYRRMSRHCELNTNVAADDTQLTDKPGWAYQGRPEWNTETECGTELCQEGEVCATEGPVKECKVRECDMYPADSGVRMLGNTNSVGARYLLACQKDKYPSSPEALSSWPVQTVCQENGTLSVASFNCSSYEANCHKYLGSTKQWSTFKVIEVKLISGPCGVKDDSLTASSIHAHEYPASNAKFDKQGTWVASETGNPHSHLQVAFDRILEVKLIQTRGRPGRGQYVTSFRVKYSNTTWCPDGTFLYDALDVNENPEFVGNKDDSTIEDNAFRSPIQAMCVRILILSTTNGVGNYAAMSFELIGTIKVPVF